MNRSTRAAIGLATMFLLAPVALFLTPTTSAPDATRGCMDVLATGFSAPDATPIFVAAFVALIGLGFVVSAVVRGPQGAHAPQGPREPWRPSTLRLAIGLGLLFVVAPLELVLVPSAHVVAVVAVAAGVAFIASSLYRRPRIPVAIVLTGR